MTSLILTKMDPFFAVYFVGFMDVSVYFVLFYIFFF